MSSDKNINLLPEDLRAKEEKSKQAQDFHIDLVVPEAVGKSKSARPAGLFSQKIKNIFSKKTRFEIPSAPKKVEEKKSDKSKDKDNFYSKQEQNQKEKKRDFSPLHIPKETPVSGEKKVHYVKKTGFDFSLPATQGAPAIVPKKASFWSKLKNFFKGKPKKKKEEKKIKESYEVKPLTNGADSILLKGINGNGVQTATPKPESIPLKSEPKLEELNLAPIIAPIKPASEKSDFSIPEIDANNREKEIPKGKMLKGTDRFHHPQSKGPARFVDGGHGLDLIPKSIRIKSWRQIGVLALVALLGSSLIAGSFFFYLSFQEKMIKNQQERKSSQISDLEKKMLEYEVLNKEISFLGEEIRTVHNLLHKHIYWTNFFAMLEKYTPAEIYYQGLSAGNKGALTLSAVGRDYDSPARLLKLLQQPEAQEFVSLVSINSASLREEGVAFSVTLVLNENLFYYGYGPDDQE